MMLWTILWIRGGLTCYFIVGLVTCFTAGKTPSTPPSSQRGTTSPVCGLHMVPAVHNFKHTLPAFRSHTVTKRVFCISGRSSRPDLPSPRCRRRFWNLGSPYASQKGRSGLLNRGLEISSTNRLDFYYMLFECNKTFSGSLRGLSTASVTVVHW